MNDDSISRQAATQTALEFIVEYLGGAFDEDFQQKLIERMNALPSADRPDAVDLSNVYSTAYKSGYEKGKEDRPQVGWIKDNLGIVICSVSAEQE